jgi:hypothetical protein
MPPEWSKINAFGILRGIPTRKRPLGSPRRRMEDNIRICLKEIGVITKNLIDSAQPRDYLRAFVNAALKLGFHKPWS